MKTKPLYVLTSDCGDGSRAVHYTFSKEIIDKLEERYDAGDMDYTDVGFDGDGFGYDTLNVPVECTYESLGITYPLEQDFEE